MIENENTTSITDPTPDEAATVVAPSTVAPAKVAATTATPPEAPAGDAESSAAAVTKPAPQRVRPVSASGWALGTGRRKTSVARVRIKPGSGKIVVNDKPMNEHFPGERDQKDIMNVLQKTNTAESVDVHVNTSGGGVTGQAGAIVLGIARALRQYDPNLESILRDNDFLTRDPREVERKKYGLAGARRRYQFSKR